MDQIKDPCIPVRTGPAAERKSPCAQSALTATGYLTVSAGTARRAYPLAEVQIEIYLPTPEDGVSSDTNNMTLYRRQVSGSDGSAEPVPIPTPEESVSLDPDSTVSPCTFALVRVYRRGYYPQEAREVPVFPGVNALQYFDLVPLSESDAQSGAADPLTVVSGTVDDFL